MPIVVALAAALALALVFGSSASARPSSSSSSSSSPPSGSTPDGALNRGTPVRQLATAKSGRRYVVWMWPEAPGVGVYTVVQAEGTNAWLAFMYNAATDTSIPLKTNITQLAGMSDDGRAALYKLFRDDWRISG